MSKQVEKIKIKVFLWFFLKKFPLQFVFQRLRTQQRADPGRRVVHLWAIGQRRKGCEVISKKCFVENWNCQYIFFLGSPPPSAPTLTARGDGRTFERMDGKNAIWRRKTQCYSFIVSLFFREVWCRNRLFSFCQPHTKHQVRNDLGCRKMLRKVTWRPEITVLKNLYKIFVKKICGPISLGVFLKRTFVFSYPVHTAPAHCKIWRRVLVGTTTNVFIKFWKSTYSISHVKVAGKGTS